MKKKSSLKHTGAFWAFCAPCCILFGVFFLVPLVLSIAFSFTNYDGWKTIDFVGLTNYITLFKDSKFYLSLGRTLLYTVCTLPFRVIIPLLVAVLLCSNRVAAKSLTRTMVYIPVLMSALVVGITINWMFSQEYGFVNFIIRSLGGTALEWSLNPRLATTTGIFMYRQHYMSLPLSLVEAARIDGASEWKIFSNIMLPLGSNVTITLTIFSFMWRWNDYILPLLVLSDQKKYTIQIAIKNFIGNTGVDWSSILAASVLSILPIVILFVILQKYIVGGVSAGGVKG